MVARRLGATGILGRFTSGALPRLMRGVLVRSTMMIAPEPGGPIGLGSLPGRVSPASCVASLFDPAAAARVDPLATGNKPFAGGAVAVSACET